MQESKGKQLTAAVRAAIVQMYTTPNPDGSWNSARAIARHFGTSHSTIRAVLQQAGIALRQGPGWYTRKLSEQARATIIALYTTPNPDGSWNSAAAIARRYQVDSSTIVDLLARAGVPRRAAHFQSKLSPEDRAALVRLYTTPNPDGTWNSSYALARRYGVSVGALLAVLKQAGVPIRGAPRPLTAKDRAAIVHLYTTPNPDGSYHTARAIARHYQVAEATIGKVLKQAGIQVRGKVARRLREADYPAVVQMYTTPNPDGSWHTLQAVAHHFQVDPREVRKVLQQAGVLRRSSLQGRYLSALDRANIVALYTTPRLDGSWHSITAIAHRYHVKTATIRAILRQAKITLRPGRGQQGAFSRAERAAIVRLYTTPNADGSCNTIPALARRYHVDAFTIYNILQAAGVPYRVRQTRRQLSAEDRALIVKHYTTCNADGSWNTRRTLAYYFQVDLATVRAVLRQAGIPLRREQEPAARDLSEAEQAAIVQMYLTRNADGSWNSSQIIARHFGVASPLVRRVLKAAGITQRRRSARRR